MQISLRDRSFIEITLTCSISEINMSLHFTQTFKMAAKSGGKMIWRKLTGTLCSYIVGQKFVKIALALSFHFQDKHVFAFYTEIQDDCQMWRENNFGENSSVESADPLG